MQATVWMIEVKQENEEGVGGPRVKRLSGC